jgi:hypothetical protein
MVELSGAFDGKRVHEVHGGGGGTPGCSAATLGLSLAEAKAVRPACSAILVRRKPRSPARSGDAALDVGGSGR